MRLSLSTGNPWDFLIYKCNIKLIFSGFPQDYTLIILGCFKIDYPGFQTRINRTCA